MPSAAPGFGKPSLALPPVLPSGDSISTMATTGKRILEIGRGLLSMATSSCWGLPAASVKVGGWLAMKICHSPQSRILALDVHPLTQPLRTPSDIAIADTKIPELVTSGTPTFWAALQYPGLQDDFLQREGLADCHTVGPGTVVFHDWRSQQENHHLDLRRLGCHGLLSLPVFIDG